MARHPKLPDEVARLYEVHDFRHAAAILTHEFPEEWGDICSALRTFRFTSQMIKTPGGSESEIPKLFSQLLRPRGWVKRRLTARMIVDDQEVTQDTHEVDYFKNRVAFDLEWNSKDQTFDRDLYAMRTFFDYDRISVGVLVTRSTELDDWFEGLGSYQDKHGVLRKYKDKYGASTTQMNKLLPRLRAGRNGGCPILVFGITTRLLAAEQL